MCRCLRRRVDFEARCVGGAATGAAREGSRKKLTPQVCRMKAQVSSGSGEQRVMQRDRDTVTPCIHPVMSWCKGTIGRIFHE